MRMYKLLHQVTDIYVCSNKTITYETIDFFFKPRQFYKVIRIKPTKYKIPDVPYDEQYECRDFKR